MENIHSLRNFLEIPYDELEKLNIEARKRRLSNKSNEESKEFYLTYLRNEKKLKAVTIGFSDLEGRFHMLDYDKNYFISNFDCLTFDGSSIRGFSRQAESDLRLYIDWNAFWWLPSDVFGGGKVLMMGLVTDQDNTPYTMDIRYLLKKYTTELQNKFQYSVQAANEIEGFLLKNLDAEKNFDEKSGFILAANGGYYHSLPNDILRIFIDRCAEAQRAMGFKNEKDHPEVAPSQFELNYSYSDAVNAADQIQIYKLICRQVAHNLGMTATFLPKPIVGINGNGMHTNISFTKNGKNIFYDKNGKGQLSNFGWDFIEKLLGNATDICLILNSSVNAYRRLDPHYEAPNEIKVSETDRGAMIRIPIFNENSARIEIRSVAPDSNPYLVLYTLIKTGLHGKILQGNSSKRQRVRYLPTNLQSAILQFRQSTIIKELLGETIQKKFAELKQTTCNRSPQELGTRVKNGEVLYHHEVYNQILWNDF